MKSALESSVLLKKQVFEYFASYRCPDGKVFMKPPDREGINALKEAKDEVFATKEEEARLKNTLEEAESEMHYLKEVIREAKAESMKLQESLTDKEKELRSVIQENKELQNTESASVIKAHLVGAGVETCFEGVLYDRR
ncbi:hypothetical protein DCAR_0934343 [Daucus carota subsp. sativus]|uniref:Uncharacterized protein n=1 Tax=Daucus carota subsp. sativus TaxID=79200 RepID=A0A175YFA3_DAUCS|nr:hypothetical protein DCAR_0934343 [Daucus carota subsp. sativus]